MADEINPLTFACGPAVVALIFTLTVQEVLAVIVAPVGLPNVSVVAPAVGAHVGLPTQVVAAAGVAATSNPAGNASVKVTPVKFTPTSKFVLVSVNVSVETPLTATGLGEKALVICGGLGTAQPVILTLSISNLLLLEFAPNALILKDVVEEPVPLAGNGTEVDHVVFTKVSLAGVVAVYALPSALDQTYT